MSIESPKAPIKPLPVTLKVVRRININFALLKVILIFFLISLFAFILLKILKANEIEIGILGIIFLPLVGLGILGFFMLFYVFRLEIQMKEVKKKKNQFENELKKYYIDYKIYENKLKEYEDLKSKQIKSDIKKTEFKDKQRREKEEKESKELLRLKLEETDRKDKQRREKEEKESKEKEDKERKDLIRLKLEESIQKNRLRKEKEDKEKKELLKLKETEHLEAIEIDQLFSNNEPPPRSIQDLIEELQIVETGIETFNNVNDNYNETEGSDSQLTIEGSFDTYYKWYALWKYFPVSRFSDHQLSSIDLTHRRSIFDFKDGLNPDKFAKILSFALIDKFGKNALKCKTLLIVPASNKFKTERRFKLFCENLCRYTGMINGYNILTNNDVQRVPKHQGGNGNILSSIKLESTVTEKDIFVIDDVRTSGKSSNDVYQFLKQKGAKLITFIYFGRTVSSNTFSSQPNITEIDDLPF